MIKVFVDKRFNSVAYLPYLEFYFQEGNFSKTFSFNNDAIDSINTPLFEVMSEIKDADVILLPHNYFQVKNEKDFLKHYEKISNDHKKPLLIIAYGDSSEYIDIPNSIVLRTSQYKSHKRENEIIIPPIADDLGRQKIQYRQKGSLPTVGFCGWAQLPSTKEYAKYGIRNLLRIGPRKQGLYFRRKAISVLKSSERVKTNFVIRSAYAGNRKTINIDPQKARKEYIENMQSSDFILAPKGDGNYSLRFYEALSLGRVPILIDTDTPLPLEDKIPYDEFIIRVDYRDIDRLDEIIAGRYDDLSDKDFIEMQKKARDAFVNHLSSQAFFEKYLPLLLKEYA